MLKDGKVLAFRGLAFGVASSAGLYDPSSGTWAPLDVPAPSREAYSSTLLGDGKVLVIGGWDGSALMDSVELYDPLTGVSSPTGSLNVPRVWGNATVIADGRKLLTGGYGVDGGIWRPLDSAETYDPASGTWAEAPEMAARRVEHTATLLMDGRVLIVGDAPNGWTEIYDPSTGTWSKAASTLEQRQDHTATLLKDGRVLIAGGASGTSGQPFPSTSAEVYDPATDTWTPSTEAAR